MSKTTKNPSALEGALHQLRQGAERLALPPGLLERLLQADRSVTVSIPVRRDDGSFIVFTGFRIQHNNLRGPYKGGIRFHPDVSPEQIKALAIWMTVKAALLNLPFGGGKGAVACAPAELSLRELEEVSRGYVRALFPVLGPERDIPAPDVNTDSRIIAWMADEYSRLSGGKPVPAAFTGKPVEAGGLAGRVTATGYGVGHVTVAMAQRMGLPIQGATVALQGFGNVGSHAAHFLHKAGAKVVAVVDVFGGVAAEEGFDIPDLMKYAAEKGTVAGYPRANPLDPEALFALPVDILIPAAMENQLTVPRARTVQARLVVEGANGPTTPEADVILQERGVTVVPDVLANAGGVTMSYLEWAMNRTGTRWTEEEVDDRFQSIMARALEDTCAGTEEFGVNLRLAAYTLALKRLAETLDP